MELDFQILDADYILTNSKPTVRLFGRTKDNSSITVFFENFLPYFFILTNSGKEEEIKDYLIKKYKGIILKIENEEKFPAIGFKSKPLNMLKVTLTNPAVVPNIRDDLKLNVNVKEIFEADILFKYRFMTDLNIHGMRWYRATGENVKTGVVKTEKKIQATSFSDLNIEENSLLKYLSIDIETVSSDGGLPDPEKDQIILISLVFYPTYKEKSSLVLIAKRTKKYDNTLSFDSEKEMLEEFLRIIDNFDPDIILGYNSTNFDLPFIDTRLAKNNVNRNLGRCAQKPIRLDKFANKQKAVIPGRVVVDVYDLIKEATAKFGLYRELKRFGLGDVSKLILGESKVDVAHSEISKFWADNGEKFEKLIDYSRKDAELPLRIIFEKNMLDKFFEMSKVSGLLLQDVLDGGEAARIENLLLKEFNKRNFVLPCRPESNELYKRNEERRKGGLKGGFVLKPMIGFHDKCVVYLDFKSMYPSIMMSLNICPTTLLLEDNDIEKNVTSHGTSFVTEKVRKGIIPEILEYLISTRDKLKVEMKNAKSEDKRRYLYAKQYAFKTIANAFYGYSGYIRARLYVIDIANTITGVGRDMIGKTKLIIETSKEYTVIYADTDSVMVKTKTTEVDKAFKIGEELSQIVNKELGGVLKIKIESVFKTLLILNKKRYAGWNFEPLASGYDESIVTKGIETVRRDWCSLVSEILQEVLNTILKEQNTSKALKLVRDKIDQIKTGKMDINKLVITKSISKSLKTYKGVQPHVELVKKMRKRNIITAPGIGDRVGFVIVQGTGMISKRAEDPEYAKNLGIKVDSKYYIESQLLPPLERVFESLNVNKSELMGIGKQMGLFDIIKNEPNSENGYEKFLTSIDGVICKGCNTVFRRVPLSIKCNLCSSQLLFYDGEKRSEFYNPV